MTNQEAIALLKADHSAVKKLFAQKEKAAKDNEKSRIFSIK